MVSHLQSRTLKRAGDRGAVLVLFALLLSGLVIIVALVIDYGFVRNTRQDSKLTTDAAVSAGLQSFGADGYPRPWTAACAALSYLEANETDRSLTVSYRDGDAPLTDASGTPINPCVSTAHLSTVCSTTKATWAHIVVTDGDNFTAEIKAPYITPDPAFAEDEGAYAGDNGQPGFAGCDQLATIIFDEDAAFFGGIASAQSYATATRSVGRIDIQDPGDGVPAFLMLERIECNVLVNQAAANTDTSQNPPVVPAGILVEPANATEPGGLHLDSFGTSGCAPNNDWTLESSDIGSSPKSPGIRVSGSGGMISLRALAPGGDNTKAYGTSAGISPVPVPGGVVSRRPVDKKYSDVNGVRVVVPAHEKAQDLLAIKSSSYTDPSTGIAYTLVDTCTGHAGAVTASHVYVDCPNGYTAAGATFADAEEVIFSGPVDVPTGFSLYLPKAEFVTVAGIVSGSDGRGITVQGGSPGGVFGVNSNAFAPSAAGTAAACNGRTAVPTQMVIFGGRTNGNVGALDITGWAALCHTSVYLAGPVSASDYAVQQTVGSVHPSCTAFTPCPKTSGNAVQTGYFTVGGYLRWVGPNTTNSALPEGEVGIEDLALWTESDAVSKVGTGGTLDAAGVYFIPNGEMQMRSPSEFNPRDAQFIARKLLLLQGLLRMQPTPGNSVPAPYRAGLNLVR